MRVYVLRTYLLYLEILWVQFFDFQVLQCVREEGILTNMGRRVARLWLKTNPGTFALTVSELASLVSERLPVYVHYLNQPPPAPLLRKGQK